MVTERIATLGLGLSIVALCATQAFAHPDVATDDYIPKTPPTYKGNDVQVQEHLGAKVPLDAKFHTQDGKQTTLGEVLAGDVPTILTFNYSDCPMLCSLQLNGLSAALPKIAVVAPGPQGKDVGFRVGAQFRIVTIDLEPNEPIAKIQKMRERYIARLPEDQRDTARKGWTFLIGDADQIKRVADTVGFKYVYLPQRAEWAHPAALIFLGASGAVTRYVYGIEFDTQMMRDSIFKAGISEPEAAYGFMNRCYHYDPDENSHAHAGVVALRVGAAGFIVLLISVFGLMHFFRKQRRNGVSS